MNVKIDLKTLHDAVVKIAKLGRKEAQKLRGDVNIVEFNEKARNSLVTEVDKGTEKFLVEELRLLLPNSNFLAEEGYSCEKITDEYTWVIDPIDGTTNMVYNIPPFAISIALLENKKPILGVICEIYSGEIFSAYKDGGAFQDNKPIQVQKCSNLKDSIIATGFPYSLEPSPDKYLSILNYMVKNARGVRRHGAASVDLAYLASGRFSGYYEINLSPWDVAAGILIVQEAGGIVEGFNLNTDPLFGETIMASTPNLFQELRNVIQEIYYPNI